LKQITFCNVFSNQNNTKIISNILLNLGIISTNIENPEKVIDLLEHVKVDFLFLDLDFTNNLSYKLLDHLNENEKYSSLFKIATSFKTKKDFINELKKYNIISFIPKPLIKKEVNDKLIILLNKLTSKTRRKHIRVAPDDDELMRISFTLKTGKRISAKVINVSLGGIAAILYSNFESHELVPGNLVEHIKFEANHKQIDVDAKIIKKKDTFLAFKFTHFYKESNKSLSKYIMNKLSV
jgi:response regulator RpfG family c-di-GMP phosphodiesterase